MSADDAKRAAAAAAIDYVEDGMILGLGTGSTATHFIDLLAAKIAQGLRVTGAPTSAQTAAQARALGVPLIDPNDATRFDLTVDGADEADGNGRLIKGGGAALLREKIIAASSARMIVIADGSKRVETLGAFPLPVEVTPFAHELTARKIEDALLSCDIAGVAPQLRLDPEGAPLNTDGGNLIYDCACGAIPEPEALDAALSRVVGVVEHGLFIDLASLLIFGHDHGVEIIDPRNGD